MSTVQEAVDVDVPVRVAYDQWTQFETFPELIDGAVGVDDHRVKADAKRFKDFIESRATPTGQWRGEV